MEKTSKVRSTSLPNEQEKLDDSLLRIEKRKGNNHSFYIDSNGILKGEWGGYEEFFCTINGEPMVGLYYSRYRQFVPISEKGFFYGIFSCRKYDGIIKLPYCGLYMCEKNGRFGVVDKNDNTILHTSFNEIRPYYWGVIQGYGMQYSYLLNKNTYKNWDEKYINNIFLIVSTETGQFLYNISKKLESPLFEHIFIGNDVHSSIIFQTNGKYGVLDLEGNILLKPFYNYDDIRHQLYYHYQGMQFSIWVENNLIYGKIPADEYDICFVVGKRSNYLSGHCYIVNRRNKFGLLSSKGEMISDSNLDEVILYMRPYSFFDNGCLRINKYPVGREIIAITYIIARYGNKYKLYNAQNGHMIIDDCDRMDYTSFGKYNDNNIYDYVEFTKGSIHGCVLWDEKIISTNEYEEVTTSQDFILVKKNGKKGAVLKDGEILFPCVYDDLSFNNMVFTLKKDGEEKKIPINSVGRGSIYISKDYPTYGRYAGTYAQDEMGYSDDDIDTIFDGDPDAYWNID